MKKNFISLLIASAIICLSLISGLAAAETGYAVHYSNKFQGKKTASGETFDQNELTAAHKTLPFGTKVTVINLTNHKRTKVHITDRGPFVQGRIIDLSKKAAKRINMVDAGVVPVELKYKTRK